MSIEIRPRRAPDTGERLQLAADVLAVDGYPPRLPDDLSVFISSPDALAAFVAVDGHDVVGHVCLNPSTSPVVLEPASRVLGVEPPRLGVVARLLVSPAHRRRGIAKRLLEATLCEADRRARLPILDVATHFHAAISLYELLGWRQAGMVTVDVGQLPPLDEFV